MEQIEVEAYNYQTKKQNSKIQSTTSIDQPKFNNNGDFYKAKKILNIIVDSLELKNTRYKQYTEFNTLLSSSDLSSEQRKLLLLQIILKITNDFKKDNSLDDLGKSNIKFSSSFNINWNCIDELLNMLTKKIWVNVMMI